MHPAQKSAIFALIDSAESQLRYAKTILAMEPEQELAQEKVRRDPRSTTASGNALLTEEEEAEMERQMEAERLAAIADQKAHQGEWSRLNKIAEEETPKPLLG